MLIEPWSITLFKGLALRRSNTLITRFRSRKAAALLARLACFANRPHPP